MYSASASICSPSNEITLVLFHILVALADEVDKTLHEPNADDDVGIDSVTDVFPPARSRGPIFLPSNGGRLSPLAVGCAPVAEPCVRLFSEIPAHRRFLWVPKEPVQQLLSKRPPGQPRFRMQVMQHCFLYMLLRRVSARTCAWRTNNAACASRDPELSQKWSELLSWS